jgi:uncharacterized protein involved in type VI secretion and phage assembly
MYEKHGGLAKGIVIDTEDPAGYKRIRVRIPELHGAMNPDVYTNTSFKSESKKTGSDINRVADSCIPWAEVNYPYGSDITPEINQVVLVGFLGGDIDKPIVLGWLGYEYKPTEEAFVPRQSKR